MAQSKCIACGSTSFEAVVKSPRNSTHKIQFIQCAICGGVIGAMDWWNIGVVLKKHEVALSKIAAGVGVILDWRRI